MPLTGTRCVDLIITEKCVFEVDKNENSLTLIEIADGVTIPEILDATGCEFKVRTKIFRTQDFLFILTIFKLIFKIADPIKPMQQA